MKEATPSLTAPLSAFAGSDWFDPLEEAVRGQVRAFIEELLEEELEPRSAVGVTSEVRSPVVGAMATGRASWSPRLVRSR